MENVLILLASLTSIYLVYLACEFFIGFNLIKNLSKQSTLPSDKLPSVSIIMSALNEEKDIHAALLSMLQQKYDDFEVIVLNDRSTDATPQIIENLAKEYSNLKIQHITDLPPNWMGKNHALQVGVGLAKGEWILFTDADVMMKPDTLSKTISYAMDKELDHLTIYELHLRNSFWLKVLMLGSYFGYSIYCMPWRIRYSWSSKALGHGAFNLVKANVYKNCGGHAAIRLECLDDMKLGALIKKNGYKQDTVDGRDFIEREWYDSMRSMISGFEKNGFAVYDYSYARMSFYCSMMVVFFLTPFAEGIFASGALQWISLLNIALTIILCAYVAQQFRISKSLAVLYPISIILLLYTVWKSGYTVYKNKGVVWRGTHYPLSELKSRKI